MGRGRGKKIDRWTDRRRGIEQGRAGKVRLPGLTRKRDRKGRRFARIEGKAGGSRGNNEKQLLAWLMVMGCDASLELGTASCSALPGI
jgi:hypothetical protein